MIFDIDKFVTIPRNKGQRYQDGKGNCCTIGAAFYACGGVPKLPSTPYDSAYFDVTNWLYELKLTRPFLHALLIGAENDHMKKFSPEMATRTVIDALLMNRSILAAEGVEVVGASDVVEKQLVA